MDPLPKGGGAGSHTAIRLRGHSVAVGGRQLQASPCWAAEIQRSPPSAKLSEATGLSDPSVSLSGSLSGLREHVPLCLADDRDRITAPLLSEQEQIGDQVDDLTDGSTVLPASVGAFG